MSLFEDVKNVQLLQKLLQPPDAESSDSEDEHLPSTGAHSFGPGDIGRAATGRTAAAAKPPYKNVYAKAPAKPISSFDEWQAQQEKEDFDILDTRKRPNYHIAYKQCVATEDVFLQMGNKSSATSSCDEIVITIEMPEETVGIERMNLSVQVQQIDLQSPVYRLKLTLPQRIDPDAGSARYETELKRLRLRLKMVREFDFVNF